MCCCTVQSCCSILVISNYQLPTRINAAEIYIGVTVLTLGYLLLPHHHHTPDKKKRCIMQIDCDVI